MTMVHQDDSRTNGRWTKEEHQKFILGLQIYGRDWKKIQALIGTRNGAQIRSHAQKFFIKIKKETETCQVNENWQQTKESPPEYLNSLNANQKTQEINQKTFEYSYYFTRMYTSLKFKLKKDLSNLDSFDFWESFIDFKQIKNCQKNDKIERKTSFLTLNSEADQIEGLKTHKIIKLE